MKSVYKTAHHRQQVALQWWAELSLETKLSYRKQYEELRKENPKRRLPYPNMVDTMNSKISQLTDRQVYSIYRFHDRYND